MSAPRTRKNASFAQEALEHAVFDLVEPVDLGPPGRRVGAPAWEHWDPEPNKVGRRHLEVR
eukprot:6487769-Lingulodinium_polyedra.AAC.1